MRSKDKSNISGQLSPGSYQKLKQISIDKGLSLIKTIEFLIDNHNDQSAPVSKPTATLKTLVKPIVLPAKKEAPNKFNLAEEMAKLRQQ